MVLKRIALLLLVLLMLVTQTLAEETEKVTYRDITVDKYTEYVDLGDRKVLQWDKLYDFLLQLPNLKKVDMYNVIVNLQVYNKLKELFPDVQFGVSFRYGAHRVRTDDTAFSTLWAEGARKYNYDEIAMMTWCTNLYALDIGHQPVKKLDFLYELPELRVLIVALCDLTDITPIASLKDLKYLMDLDLVQNYVEDLTPLTEITSLKRLWIYRNIKHDLESPDMETVQMLQEALPDCQIEARGTSRSKGWVRHPHQEVIQRIFHSKVYEPFADSDPENMPEPWRTEYLEKSGETAQAEAAQQ